MAQAKRPETRQKRIAETLERAKAKRDHPGEADGRDS
ncbi:hypothetical protein [Trichococcus ilyis]